MGFEFYKESYAGAIKEISIGEGSKAVTVGGETCYPFYQFEGDMPHKPKIAMEVWDIKPDDWPEAALIPFKDVVDNPAGWAKKCVDVYGAEIIVLQLKSIDPNGINASPEAASAIVKKVLEAIDVPLIIWGIANAEKDEAVLKQIAEDCQDSRLIMGPVEDKNHKSIGAAAMGYGHYLISSSPIDVNLAKQVNILLENLGMPMDRVLIDPTTGGLGYGLEYTYSVMERLRMAAMAQGDDKLQMPIVNNLGNEIWKSKEAKQSTEESPLLGDPERRGVLMEAVGAVAYLMAGSDLIIMRHPEAVRMIKSYIDLIMDGGTGMEVAPIRKEIDDVYIDFASLAPTPNLTIEETIKKAAPAAKKAAPAAKKATPVAEKAKLKQTVEEAKVSVEDPATAVNSNVELEVKAKEEAKLKAELEVKAKEEAKLKAELEVKAKEEAKLKAEADIKVKAEVERKAAVEAMAKAALEREAEEMALREKRAMERSKITGSQVKEKSCFEFTTTPAPEQKDNFEKIIDKLQWVHKRVQLYKW